MTIIARLAVNPAVLTTRQLRTHLVPTLDRDARALCGAKPGPITTGWAAVSTRRPSCARCRFIARGGVK